MSTAEHLQGYYRFSPAVVDSVSEFTDRQAGFSSYQEFFDSVGMPNPAIYKAKGFKPLWVTDIRPKEHNPNEAIFYHLAMANPLDANQMFQVASVAATNPNKRVIAAGNPSAPGYKSGKLTLRQAARVARGDFAPTVDPLLRYADEQHIDVSHQVGGSYGADEAMETTRRANHTVRSAVVIEPVIGKRSFKGLAADFKSSEAALNGYVRSSGLPLFENARKESVSGNAYILGLLRLSNLAITEALTKGGFEKRTTDALVAQRHMHMTAAWGTDSELARPDRLSGFVFGLMGAYPERVGRIMLPGQRHALGNDVPLQLALIAEGLKAA